MAETLKARDRRVRERWFERFLVGHGVDVGCGSDPVTDDCARWDRPEDAHVLRGTWDWVYSSHCLEHLERPEDALRSWWSCLNPGGRLIVIVPHRDLYEKRLDLPSRWNGDHKHFWLPVAGDRLGTRGLLETVTGALPDARLERLSVEETGWDPVPEHEHSHGEYQIEGVWRKVAHRSAP
jgi:SAM-dependent methyltransferase